MIVLLIISLFILAVVVRIWRGSRSRNTIAFFHPYCDGGGGGERVLFQAIQTLKNIKSIHQNKRIIVYSRVPRNKKHETLSSVFLGFNISIDEKDVDFVELHTVKWMNPKNFPRFTLLFQSLAELLVAFEAIIRCLPEIFIDTTGCSLSIPLFKILGGCKIACYVHYPTITTQMIKRIENRAEMYNNSGFIAKNEKLTAAKVFYYQLFAKLYKFAGSYSDVVMVNGSWTEEHIKNLWNCQPIKVYPPVDFFIHGDLSRDKGNPIKILSVGQIRPEKNHKLQLEILQLTLNMKLDIQLIIAGGCRNEEDKARVDELKKYAEELEISDKVSWMLNVLVDELKELNRTSLIGIHTMTEEHFGIAVVESMAAGVIMIAHNSGGPKLDIVHDGETGYLATTADEYAKCIEQICSKTNDELQVMRIKAKKSMERFSVEEFEKNFVAAMEKL